jgi:hypothetical protein
MRKPHPVGLTDCLFQRFRHFKRLVPSCGKVEHCQVCAPLAAVNIERHDARAGALLRRWDAIVGNREARARLAEMPPVTEVLR